jgi:predicted transcriptional regulator
MELSEVQRRILDILAEKSLHSVNTSVLDTAIVAASSLPGEEVNTYLSQLESLGLVKLGIKVNGADFRLVNITEKGLEVTS